MNADTERPAPIAHTFTVTVEVNPNWVDYITQDPDIFGRPHESRRLGVSRRLSALPKGLVLGETWVLLAHLDAVPAPGAPEACATCGVARDFHAGPIVAGNRLIEPCASFEEKRPTPGIFCAFVPRAVELILAESDATQERREKEAKRGVTVVAVPDGDRDHQGSVWDGKDEDSQPELPGVSP